MITGFDKKGLIQKALNDAKLAAALESEDLDLICEALYIYLWNDININSLYIKCDTVYFKCCIIFKFLLDNGINLFEANCYNKNKKHFEYYSDLFPNTEYELNTVVKNIRQVGN